jgi:armadillo repeat-containing protein 4
MQISISVWIDFSIFCSRFKCAEEKATRDAVRQNGGLDPLVTMLKAETAIKDGNNKPIVAALSGALWKCAISPENVRRLEELNTMELLVSCLQCEDNEEVQTCFLLITMLRLRLKA